MNLFWLLGALCNYTVILIVQLGMDFWVLSPPPIRFVLDTENLRIKSGSIHDVHQLKSGFALNWGHVLNLDKDFLGPGLQKSSGLARSQSCVQHGMVSQNYEVLFQRLFLVFSHLCTGRLWRLNWLRINHHSADRAVIKGKSDCKLTLKI